MVVRTAGRRGHAVEPRLPARPGRGSRSRSTVLVLRVDLERDATARGRNGSRRGPARCGSQRSAAGAAFRRAERRRCSAKSVTDSSSASRRTSVALRAGSSPARTPGAAPGRSRAARRHAAARPPRPTRRDRVRRPAPGRSARSGRSRNGRSRSSTRLNQAPCVDAPEWERLVQRTGRSSTRSRGRPRARRARPRWESSRTPRATIRSGVPRGTPSRTGRAGRKRPRRAGRVDPPASRRRVAARRDERPPPAPRGGPAAVCGEEQPRPAAERQRARVRGGRRRKASDIVEAAASAVRKRRKSAPDADEGEGRAEEESAPPLRRRPDGRPRAAARPHVAKTARKTR